jgi:aminopeptidase 2
MSPANGFYLSSYSDAPIDAEGAGSKDDPLKYYAQTQFQPTGARKAFPCFDEPGLKATFQMRMLVRPDHVAINNMPELSSRPAAVAAAADGEDARLLKLFARTRSSSAVIAADLEELKLVKFGQTPLMSSYLVAFATGDFQYVEDSYVSKRSGRTIPLRIYSTPNAVHELDSALHNTKLTVTLWEEVFQIGFPLPKLDTLSVSSGPQSKHAKGSDADIFFKNCSAAISGAAWKTSA